MSYKGFTIKNVHYASLTSLTTVDTITKSFTGEADIGIATAKGVLQIPLFKQKSAIFIAGRRSYYDILFKTFGKGNADIFAFQDYNIGWIYQPNKKNKIKFTYYHERDEAGTVVNETGFSKGSAYKKQNAFGLSWKYNINNQFSNEAVLYQNTFSISLTEERRNVSTFYKYNFTTAIADVGLKNTLTYTQPKATSFIGFEAIRHNFMPTKFIGDEQGEQFNIKNIDDFNALDVSFFASSLIQLGSNAKLNVGLRNNNYVTNGSTFNSIEPRLTYNYQIKTRVLLKYLIHD